MSLRSAAPLAALLLVTFSIGVAAGSLLCERLSGRKVEIGLVPFGSIGLTLFALDLYFATPVLPAAASLDLAGLLRLDGGWRVFLATGSREQAPQQALAFGVAGARTMLAVKGRFGVPGVRGSGATSNPLADFWTIRTVGPKGGFFNPPEHVYQDMLQTGLGMADPALCRIFVDEVAEALKRDISAIGWPVGHSLSPRLHGHWLQRHGIDGAYLPLPVRPEDWTTLATNYAGYFAGVSRDFYRFRLGEWETAIGRTRTTPENSAPHPPIEASMSSATSKPPEVDVVKSTICFSIPALFETMETECRWRTNTRSSRAESICQSNAPSTSAGTASEIPSASDVPNSGSRSGKSPTRPASTTPVSPDGNAANNAQRPPRSSPHLRTHCTCPSATSADERANRSAEDCRTSPRTCTSSTATTYQAKFWTNWSNTAKTYSLVTASTPTRPEQPERVTKEGGTT